MSDTGAPLGLVGIANARDFGGKSSVFGGMVATRRLLRSGHHAQATEDDLALIGGLGLRTVVDLRRASERAAQPSRRPPDCAAEIIEESWDESAAAIGRASGADADVAYARQRLEKLYQNILFDVAQRQLARRYFRALAATAGEGPVLIHCTAGKDRTGVLAALTLLALGVPHDEIMDDFLRSNDALASSSGFLSMQRALAKSYGSDLPDEVVAAFARVAPEHLLDLFRVLDSRFGGVESYLALALEIGSNELARLRESLLV